MPRADVMRRAPAKALRREAQPALNDLGVGDLAPGDDGETSLSELKPATPDAVVLRVPGQGSKPSEAKRRRT
jgi:hypothetical protein